MPVLHVNLVQQVGLIIIIIITIIIIISFADKIQS